MGLLGFRVSGFQWALRFRGRGTSRCRFRTLSFVQTGSWGFRMMSVSDFCSVVFLISDRTLGLRVY